MNPPAGEATAGVPGSARRRGPALAGSPVASGLRVFLPDLALVAIILVALWGGIGMQLARERSDAIETAERTADNTAGAAEQVISRTIEAIDQRLLFMRQAFRRDPLGFSLEFVRESDDARNGPALLVAVIGPDGRLLMTNLGPLRGPVDLSDRAHFRTHLDGSRDELFVGVPILTRVSDRWAVHFTRRLVGEDGSFAGVAVVSLDPQWLTQLYETLGVGRGIMMLAGLDGIVRARAPHLPETLGLDMSGAPIHEASRRRERGAMRTVSPVDGTERLVSFRRLPGRPLVLMVGRDTSDILAGYGALRLKALLAGGALTLLVLLAGGLLIRHKRQLIASQRALGDAVENISQGLIMVDRHGGMPVMNRRAAELLGLPASFVASRPSFARLQRWQRETGEFGPPDASGPPPAPAAGSGFAFSPSLYSSEPLYERTRPDGMVLEVRTQLLAGGGAVRTYADVTERRLSEERIRFLAHHDALTGLANRFLLHERLDHALSRRGEQEVAVLALDLDRFKAVNDTMGHVAGDQLLTQAAERLRACVRAHDTVARIGGDEFVVVQVGATPASAEELARRLVARMGEPFLLDGREARIGTSVGLALPPANGTTSDAMLLSADTALYRAKSEGRGGIRFFEPEMGARRQARRELEQDLRHALEAGGLDLHYQPVLDCRTGATVACEALVRWTHAVRGPVSPAEFIPVAEESGLILPLGRWVLERACAAASAWPGGLRVAVNVSPAQFRDEGLTGRVVDVLRATGLAAHRLELEVTEGLLIRDTDQALEVIRALKAEGVVVTLDDFGTGYSSLGYLRRFPFDRVKVDRSFVAALDHDPDARAIVGAILGMGASLGLSVTAEGVETEAQRDFLFRHGCDELQGFLLARPMPSEELAAYFARTGLTALSPAA